MLLFLANNTGLWLLLAFLAQLLLKSIVRSPTELITERIEQEVADELVNSETAKMKPFLARMAGPMRLRVRQVVGIASLIGSRVFFVLFIVSGFIWFIRAIVKS